MRHFQDLQRLKWHLWSLRGLNGFEILLAKLLCYFNPMARMLREYNRLQLGPLTPSIATNKMRK